MCFKLSYCIDFWHSPFCHCYVVFYCPSFNTDVFYVFRFELNGTSLGLSVLRFHTELEARFPGKLQYTPLSISSLFSHILLLLGIILSSFLCQLPQQ